MANFDKSNFKIVFIQYKSTPQEGIMAISAVLKEHGFSTDIFSITVEQDDVVENVLNTNPDIIGCSVMTPVFKTMMKVITAIKQRNPKRFIIMGGVHPTFFPEVLSQEKDLDAICIGEGEYAMLELALSIKSGELNTNIKNLWVRQNGNIIKNELRDLIANLDSLPLPDRDLYFTKYPFLIKETIKFTNGRGCPFDCSYCFNKGMRSLYKGKGCWLRFKSSERVIEEIKEFNKKYPIKWLSFVDDTFNADKKRLREFLKMYKKEINIPFLCQLRIDLASEEQIELLKQAGVEKISVGIEHGDEEFRRNILNRHITNKQILDFGKWVYKRKIRLYTQNIIGFPGETLDLAFSTIELNAKIKPELAMTNILNPYPGTDIYKYAKDNGYLSDDFDHESLMEHSTALSFNAKIRSGINNENKQQLINLRCFFMLLVHYPWLTPLVKILIKFPHNRLYELIWQVTGIFRTTWRYAEWDERKRLLKGLVSLIRK